VLLVLRGVPDDGDGLPPDWELPCGEEPLEEEEPESSPGLEDRLVLPPARVADRVLDAPVLFRGVPVFLVVDLDLVVLVVRTICPTGAYVRGAVPVSPVPSTFPFGVFVSITY
jgi:hypothetical protein